jgi:hypothetical protein
MTTPFEEQIEFCKQLKSVSQDLADWADQQFDAGRSLDHVKEQLLRVMKIVTPLRAAAEPVAENVTRTETEMNFGWAQQVPHLFVKSIQSFQKKTPITHWRHFIDLSRDGFITLIAQRRETPFDSVTEYLADDKRYLREVGVA